ncbi:MAG: dihydrofolate reductase family protein, partial [Chitinophagaceae bacterium]
FNTLKHEENGNLLFFKVKKEMSLVQQVMNALFQLKITSVLVEGGATILQSFINEGVWDEARVICNEDLKINSGLPAPVLSNAVKISEQKIFSDKVEIYKAES